jgi:hypothetical protein
MQEFEFSLTKLAPYSVRHQIDTLIKKAKDSEDVQRQIDRWSQWTDDECASYLYRQHICYDSQAKYRAKIPGYTD